MISVKTFLHNYCKTSSLHGLRYVILKESKPWERRLWIALIAIAGITILVHLYASWKTYSYTSMEITVDNPRYPLHKINFPAITICSVNKIMYTKAKKLILDNYNHDPELRTKYENALYTLGMLKYPSYKHLADFIENHPVTNLPTENITNLMLKLMPNIHEMFASCYWRGTGHNCSQLMRLQRTDEGFCYSFNSKTAEKSKNDSNIPPMAGSDGDLIPLKNNAIGKMSGLEVIMKDLVTEYFPFDKQIKGFNVMVHTPEDFPDISNSYKLFHHYNQSARISVSVSYIKADKSLMRITEKERNCFFYKKKNVGDERLPSYRSNAEDNCFSRCRIRVTAEICNCTPYYFNSKETKRHCGIEHMQCLSKLDVLQRNIYTSANTLQGFPKWSIPTSMNCSCPHPCSFVGYTTEVRHYTKDFMEFTKFPEKYIHIDIHFKERFAIRYQRVMKYTALDLLVTFGGMASLFLGCSLVTLIEIIYIFYKSLLMLKHKNTKVHPALNKQHLLRLRRHHSNKFCKPLYKAPSNKPPEVCFTVEH